MVQGESPAVARRRLRLALRKAREVKGLTQGQVAESLQWSLSKVQRIEGGEVAVSHTDLTALLRHYDVTDVAEVAELAEIARHSRRRKGKGWWDEPRYRAHLTRATIQLLQFEGEATEIRVFNPTMPPGLLQTRAYAQHILDYWQGDLSETDRAVRLEVRLQRHKHVFERENPPQYHLLLDQSALHREVGGPDVMAEQLRHLLSFVQSGRIDLRVVPYKGSAVLTSLNNFILFDLGDHQDEILYREAHIADEIIQDADMVKLYRQRFELMWSAAMSKSDTIDCVTSYISDLEAQR